MNQIIQRNHYLQKLIDRRENGLVKVITGIRRCGKSFLLFNLFYDYLIESGVKEEQIISIALDDDTFIKYRDPEELSKFIRSKITSKETYYILIDEVQYAIAKDELKNPDSIRCIISAPARNFLISSMFSSAAFCPISGFAPAPSPLVSFSPI